MFIDSDTHVDECSETWSYFPANKINLRPSEMAYTPGESPAFLASQPSNGWFIDGQIYPRRIRDDNETSTTIGTRELYDVQTRMKHMDQLNIERQVVYPTLLLHEYTRRAEVEIPVCESYNRWMADRTVESDGRMQWVAALPLRSIPDALQEMRRVKEAGAVAIFKRAFECDDRRTGDPYFLPIYQLAEELDLPICVHVSRPYTGNLGEWSPTQHGIHHSFFLQDAFLSLLLADIPHRFPNLRFGFIEAGAGWLNYAMWLAYRAAANYKVKTSWAHLSREELLHESRIFITCELSEDLPALIGQFGDANLCVGTDYVHSDPHFDLSIYTELFSCDGVSGESAEKISQGNARRLYGLA